jgi:adenosylcobinamide amidohydrolase
MTTTLTKNVTLNHTPNHIHVEFSIPHQVISSAVLNGGLVYADHLVNLKVPKCLTAPSSPSLTLAKYCEDAHWDGNNVGMMTAASMDSFRMAKQSPQGIDIVVLVTSSLSNPRRVGDRAEHRIMAAEPEEIGTINIIMITSAILTGAAMIEALLIVTEVKTAALQNTGIKSPVSDKIATGTGTDSVAVKVVMDPTR